MSTHRFQSHPLPTLRTFPRETLLDELISHTSVRFGVCVEQSERAHSRYIHVFKDEKSETPQQVSYQPDLDLDQCAYTAVAVAVAVTVQGGGGRVGGWGVAQIAL
jgi:hypothetical protein